MSRAFRPVFIPVLAVILAVSAGCTKQARKERRLKHGNEYAANGEYDKAEIAYRAALQLVPEDPAVLGRIGVLYYNDGRLLPAFLLLEQALKSRPDDLDLLLTYGLAAEAVGKTSDARSAAKTVLQSRPANEDAMLLLVETSITSRDVEESRQLIEAARQAGKDQASFHVAYGALALLKRDFGTAQNELQQAVTMDPKSSGAYAELGTLYLLQNDRTKAKDALQRGAELSPLRAPRRLKYINFLIETGAADAARKELDAITSKAPDYIPAWVMAMHLAFQQGKVAECEAAITSILDRDKMNYDALMQRAGLALLKNDTDGVIAVLQTLAGYYPRAPQIKYQLALAYSKKGDPKRSQDYLTQALALSPNYDDAIVLQADLNLRKDNPAPVVSALQRLIKRHPLNGRPYIMLAQAYRMQSNFSDALLTLQRFVQLFPRIPDGPYLVGMTLMSMDRAAEARPHFEKSLQIQPDYWPAVEMLVNDDLLTHHESAAAERIEAMLKQHPKAVAPWLLRARIRLAAGNAEAAESDLQQAITLDPNSQYAYFQLAKVYYQLNRGPDALAKLTEIAAKAPTVSSLMQLGMLQAALQRYDDARASYEKLLAINPQFSPAINNLAVLYSDQLHELDKAYALARQARDLSTGDPVVADTLGWIMVRRHDYDAAVPFLETAVAQLGSEPEYQYHFGMALYYAGRDGDAAMALRKALAVSTSPELKADISKRLAILAIDPATADADLRDKLEKRLSADPGDPQVLYRLAIAEQRLGANERAAEHLEAALKIMPRSARVMRSLVSLYLGPVSKPARARELAKQAHEVAPNDPQISWDLGRMLAAAREYSWAASLLQEANREMPNDNALLFDAASALYNAGRVSEADSAIADLLQRDLTPELKTAAAKLRTVIAATKDPSRAQDSVVEAQARLQRDPGDLSAQMVIAMASDQGGDYRAAARGYERILTQNPTFAPALRQLALLYADHLGDDRKAETYATKAWQSFPDDAQLAYAMGAVAYRRGDFPAAVKYLQQSLRGKPDNREALFFLGLSHYQLKNRTDSRVELQRALELQLPEPEASEAGRVLQELERTDLGM